jgi:phenylalanyl-tRNA synthetase beta chain
MTFAFIDALAAAPFAEGAAVLPLANPLSEKAGVLRPSLLPGLLESVRHNRRRERRDVRLFEVADRYSSLGETRGVGLVWTGAATAEHWSGPARPVDFYDVKGAVERVCSAFGVETRCEPAEIEYLEPGRAAAVMVDDGAGAQRIGIVGQLSSKVAAARDLPAGEDIYVGELDLDLLARVTPREVLQVRPLPRYPSIVRDLSVLVDEALPAATVRGTIRSAAPATLVSIREFDRYRGKGIPEGCISLSLRLTFRSADRTLTDAEADEAMADVLAALRRAHRAERR